MVANISPKLQRQHENIHAYNMIMHLKEFFDEVEFRVMRPLRIVPL
jgi:hypothetical protein